MSRTVAHPSPAAGPLPAVADAAGALDLDALYRLHAHEVARWAERLAGPGFDIEDLVHDVFLVAQRRHREWRGQAKPSTWLYEITIRVVQRRRRTRRRWRLIPWRREQAEAGWPTSALPVAPTATPGELYERRTTTALLYQLLEGLDDKYRTPLILFELEGLPGREIAALTGTTLANVWVRIMRARGELARRLQAREQEPGR
jgi:RNA polymerase sigma-70 factor, ECF subfamily